MFKFNLTEASKIVGISRKSIQRKVNSGQISCITGERNQKLIDASELIRVFGNIKLPEQENIHAQKKAMSTLVHTDVHVEKPDPELIKQIQNLSDVIDKQTRMLDNMSKKIEHLESTLHRLEYKPESKDDVEPPKTHLKNDKNKIQQSAKTNIKTPENPFQAFFDDIPTI